MKKLLATVSAVVLSLAMAAMPAVAASAAQPADLLCTQITDSSYSPKVDAGVDDPFYVNIPAGYTLVAYCVKAGTEPVIVTLATPVVGPASVQIDHPNKNSVSHYQLKLVATPVVDVCDNIDGAQATVPAGMVLSANGTSCETPPPPPVDVCDNVDGVQTQVPAGMELAPNGTSCVTPDPDCDDLTGGRGFAIGTVDCPVDPIAVTVSGDPTDQVCVPSGDETPGTLTDGSIQLTVSDVTGIQSISYSTGGGSSTDVDLATLLVSGLEPGVYDFVVTVKAGYEIDDDEFSVTVKDDKSTQCAKVTLCHWTNGDHWNVLNISQAAVVSQGHSLPEPSDHKWDIIPPFGDYAGKNWDATSDNSPEAFGSYPFNGQQGSQIFPDCDVPDEPEPEQVSVVHGSEDEQCDLFDDTQIVGGSITIQVFVGGVPVTLPNAAVTITVKGPGDLAYGPLPDLSDLPDGLYEFEVEVADGYDLTSPATFSETVANKDAEDCDLGTLGPIVPQVTFTDPTCFVDGSYTLVSPAPEEGLPAKTVTWFVNGVETEPGTYPVTSPASVVVKVVASPGYTFEDFVTEITYPAHEFAVDETCDLDTLALTGQEQPSPLLLVAGFLGLLGVALARTGVRVARRTAD